MPSRHPHSLLLFDSPATHTLHCFIDSHESRVATRRHVRYKRHVRWSPQVAHTPVPRGALTLRKLHLLSAPFVPTNLGHLAWEEAFPLLLAMAQLGEYEEEAQSVVLRTHACNETAIGLGRGSEAPTASEARLCSKFLDGFMRPLGELTTLRSLRDTHARRGVRHVCFKRVLAGGYFELFNEAHHPGKEPWLHLYRHRVLAFHRLATPSALPPPPASHTLLLVNKQGRRGIANFDEVLAFASGGCGGVCTGIGRSNIKVAAFHTMTIREQ